MIWHDPLTEIPSYAWDVMPAGFCSGSFDILHCGHAEFLRKCRGQCEQLVAMVPTDAQVRHLKGPNRPVVAERERLLMVDAIRWVDYCFLDPWGQNDLGGILNSFELLKPARYFCGPDSHDMERRRIFCRLAGVEMVIVPRYEGITTTQLVEASNVQGTVSTGTQGV